MIIPVSFERYNKISDDIMYLGDCMVLKFNVNLAKKDKNGERQLFHKEFEYGPRYDRRNSIKRIFDFYVSIENFKESSSGMKDGVRISMADMYYMKSALNGVFKWFFDENYKNIYVQKGTDLVLMNRPPRINVGLMYGYISFDASIYVDRDGLKLPGVRMYINSDTNFSDMSVDTFLGMKYFMDNLNMYESAQLMLNYMQRPELGTNLYTIYNENDYTIPPQEKDVQYKQGRQIPGKSKSFFDKVDNELK